MMDRDSYFSERIYLGQNDEIDTEVYAYWEKILGKDVLDSVEHLYGSLNSIIDSSEYKTKDINPFREYESMAEQVSNANGKQGLYVRFPDQKLVFSEFFVPLINLGINDMKKNGNVFLSESVIDEYSNVLLERLAFLIAVLFFGVNLVKKKILLLLQNEIYEDTIFLMIDKIFNIDLSYFESHSSGDVESRFNSINDICGIRRGLPDGALFLRGAYCHNDVVWGTEFFPAM